VPIRFHLDEHISARIAAGLRRRHIDVTTAAEAGLAGADDAAQLEFATSSGRVLVTHDADFLRLHAGGAAHAGIAYCRQGAAPIGELLRLLVLIHDLLSPEEMAGRVEFL
jgi:predicted nuclease of predicted toxin-antitoxin system